jgi:hypothetical protein
MKGFFIEITNNLLDPKHQKAMKDSVWLFMWLLDKITSIDEGGIGKILGGKPIKPEEIIKDLGISERTYWNWMKILLSAGYINTKRTSFGCVITVNKARKRFGRSAKSGKEKCNSLHSEVQDSALTKKTLQDNNKDTTNVIIKSFPNDDRTINPEGIKRLREIKEKGLKNSPMYAGIK